MKGGLKMKLKSLCLLLICVLLMAGCGIRKDEKRGFLKITIDWDEFGANSYALSMNKILETSESEDITWITHTGVRVLYPGDNASYSQSVNREIAETQGIITLQIPVTSDARLYAVAVHSSEKFFNRRALWMGCIEELAIYENEITAIDMDDIGWVETAWHPEEGFEDFGDGLTAPKENDAFELPIYVRDPYQVGENIAYSESILKINGTSECFENLDGWRRFLIYNYNSTIGIPHMESYAFQPCIDHSWFNLPEGRYFIEPIVQQYTISWE